MTTAACTSTCRSDPVYGRSDFKATPIPHVPGWTARCEAREWCVGIPTWGYVGDAAIQRERKTDELLEREPGAAGTITTLFGDVVAWRRGRATCCMRRCRGRLWRQT